MFLPVFVHRCKLPSSATKDEFLHPAFKMQDVSLSCVHVVVMHSTLSLNLAVKKCYIVYTKLQPKYLCVSINTIYMSYYNHSAINFQS